MHLWLGAGTLSCRVAKDELDLTLNDALLCWPYHSAFESDSQLRICSGTYPKIDCFPTKKGTTSLWRFFGNGSLDFNSFG